MTTPATNVFGRPNSADAPIVLSGGEAIARMLKLYEVGPMFGMGGFQLLPMYEGFRALGLVHHLIEDERSGAFAAHAMARVTGRPAVCDATLGPGATNLITALIEALNSGVPVIAIVGDTHRSHSWKNMTQEARQSEILRPAVKELIRIEDVRRIPELIRRAFSVSTAGRPGPVVVAVPEDISHVEAEFDPRDFWIDGTSVAVPAFRSKPDPKDIEHAAALIQAAERPIILAGGGVHLSGAYDALRNLAQKGCIPVAHTLSGKGAIACTDSLAVGLFGRYSRTANDLIQASDCVLVVGCKLGEIATKRYALPLATAQLIQLDIEPEEIGRWARVDVALWGDARAGIEDLVAAVGDSTCAPRNEYLAEVERGKSAWHAMTASLYESDEKPIHMARLIAELRSAVPDDGILVADGGFASHWAGLLYDTHRSGCGFLADRGFASIGYGLPGSIGAQLANPTATVVGLTGDGGFNMSIGGLELARRVGANCTLVVVNNAASGYVKALQYAAYGTGHFQSSDLTELNYARIADAFGCQGIRVEDPADLRGALVAAIANTDSPTVVDVVVTRDAAKMLPGVDSRVAKLLPGDRIA